MVSDSTYIIILFMVVQSQYSASGSGIERLCPIPVGGWSSPCHTACTNDIDCHDNKKCCRLSTCATYCAVPILIDAYGVVTSTSPYPSTDSTTKESKIMSEHNVTTVTTEVLKTNMSEYQYEITVRPTAGKQSAGITDVSYHVETISRHIPKLETKNVLEVTESPSASIVTSGTKSMSQHQNEMTEATSTDIPKTETTNMAQYQNEMTEATSTDIPKTETTSMSQHQIEMTAATSTDIPKTETTNMAQYKIEEANATSTVIPKIEATNMSQYQNEVTRAISTVIPKIETTNMSENQKEQIKSFSTDISTHKSTSSSINQFKVTEAEIIHHTSFKGPELSVSIPSTLESMSTVPVTSYKCYTECNRNSDCETGFLCVKLGCHQVCKVHIFRNIAFYKPLNNPKEIFSIFKQIHRNSLNLAKEDIKRLSTNKAGCRQQCDTDADCNHGYCVNVNCHSICRRKIVIKY